MQRRRGLRKRICGVIGVRFAANGEPEVSLAAAIMVSKWWTRGDCALVPRIRYRRFINRKFTANELIQI
jgi:hypothetical protein